MEEPPDVAEAQAGKSQQLTFTAVEGPGQHTDGQPQGHLRPEPSTARAVCPDRVRPCVCAAGPRQLAILRA